MREEKLGRNLGRYCVLIIVGVMFISIGVYNLHSLYSIGEAGLHSLNSMEQLRHITVKLIYFLVTFAGGLLLFVGLRDTDKEIDLLEE